MKPFGIRPPVVKMPTAKLAFPASIARLRPRRRAAGRRSSPDGTVLRRVRIRLIAWSAGSTLAVLVLLGPALYWAVAQTLVAQSTQGLENRLDDIARKIATPGAAEPVRPAAAASGNEPAGSTRDPGTSIAEQPLASGEPPVNVTTDATQPGLVFGGSSTGTIAFTIDPNSGIAVKLSAPTMAGGPGSLDIPEPDQARQQAARAGRTVVWEQDLYGTPARFVLKAVDTDVGRVLIEAIGDRTSEIQLLRSLIVVMLSGGLAAVAAAAVVGYAYAGRALVPIRLSMQHQRDFAADASHELRTPLAIVRGAAEELRHSQDDAERARSVADIEAGVERLTNLVDDLLLLARADSGTLELRQELLDLGDVAAESVARLSRLAGQRSVRLTLDVAPAAVLGDPQRLAQVVTILVDNAIRHSPEGTTVAVTVCEGARIVVDDQGPGIRSEDAPRLFDRFWRASDAPAGGTGLGLSIAAWIVHNHGGTITAVTRPEGGARFEASIPYRASKDRLDSPYQ